MEILLIEQSNLIMYGLLFIMFGLIVAIMIIDHKAKKEPKEESDFVFKIDEEKANTLPNAFSDLTNISEEQKASYELEQLKNNMLQNDDTKEKVDIEDENINLTQFEQKQEESAVISYQDLIKKADTLYEDNDIIGYQDEGNEPINILELNKPKEEIKPEPKELILDDFILPEEELGRKAFYEEPKDEVKKFTNTPFISPIYGMEKTQLTEEVEIPVVNNSSYEKLDEELRKMNEFLNMLKDLEKKLN